MPPTSCRSSSKKSWAFCGAKICQVRSYGFAPAQPESCAFQICRCQSCFECFRDPSDQPELCIKHDHIFPIVPHGISVLCPVPDVPALWDVVGLDDPFCCAYPVLSTIPEEITVSQLVLVALITVNSGKIIVITLITFITLIIIRDHCEHWLATWVWFLGGWKKDGNLPPRDARLSKHQVIREIWENHQQVSIICVPSFCEKSLHANKLSRHGAWNCRKLELPKPANYTLPLKVTWREAFGRSLG